MDRSVGVNIDLELIVTCLHVISKLTNFAFDLLFKLIL